MYGILVRGGQYREEGVADIGIAAEYRQAARIDHGDEYIRVRDQQARRQVSRLYRNTKIVRGFYIEEWV